MACSIAVFCIFTTLLSVSLNSATLNSSFDKECIIELHFLIISRVLSKDLTSEHKVGLLMLHRRFGMVVLLGVIFGSLAFTPGDDAIDMLSSSSRLI